MIVIIVGTLLALTVNWKSITHKVIKQASLPMLIVKFIENLNLIRYWIRSLMSNKLNYYIIITLLIFIVIVGYGYISVGFPKVHELHVSSFGPLEVILSVVTVIIGISLIFIRQRLTMVILNGIIGFAVTLYFIAMKAQI